MREKYNSNSKYTYASTDKVIINEEPDTQMMKEYK